nr:alkaline phosphatase PhoX [Roseovarius sp. EL26]
MLIQRAWFLSALGTIAATVKRPEWVVVNPNQPELCVALTNNKNRGVKPNAGGDDTSANAVNTRIENHYGQIARWMPADGDHTANTVTWDLFCAG